MRFNARCKWEVSNIPIDLKPVEELLVKTFISKLKPPKLRTRTHQQGCQTFQEAYQYALKTAAALDNVGLMIPPMGVTDASTPASKSA